MNSNGHLSQRYSPALKRPTGFTLEDFRSRLKEAYRNAFVQEWRVLVDSYMYERSGSSSKELLQVQLEGLTEHRDVVSEKIQRLVHQLNTGENIA
jgi:hypothetical protein